MVLTKWRPTPKPINQAWDELFDNFFYRWPKETKPPIEAYSVYNEDNTALAGIRIQMALAGFSEEDVKVWFDEEEGKLHISGSNKDKEDILDRFKCEFDHTIVYSSELDVQNSKVTLVNGMLDVFVPLIEKKQKKVFLFGK